MKSGNPVGIQSFRDIRDQGLYYVDKTRLIDRLLSKPRGSVCLFTRPRRFGKSLNISMLDAYFNMRYAGNTWFDGLEISRLRPGDPEKNAHPVIYLDLNGVNCSSFETFLGVFANRVADILSEFPELEDSDRLNRRLKDVYERLMSAEADQSLLSDSLANTSRILYAQFGVKPLLLIDEYDTAANETYGEPRQDEIMGFLRPVLTSVLKGNENLWMGVVTGVMQLARESASCGLNNLDVDSVLSTGCEDLFGFTADEVRTMCRYYGHPEKYGEAREWYDGYRFGNADIYNPWSVLKYIDSGFVPDVYWGNTSENRIINDLLSDPGSDAYAELATLASGGAVDSDFETGTTFDTLGDEKPGILFMMTMGGFLTAESREGGYVLTIPNREMYYIFSSKILSSANAGALNRKVRLLGRAILEGDTEAVGSTLGDLLKSSVSSRALGNEHAYQTFVLGLMMGMQGNYRVTGDMEAGSGYYDMVMERVRGDGPNVVAEFKVVRDPGEAEAAARGALEQIRGREYFHDLEGRTILYGFAFCRKNATVVSETLDL